MLFLATESGNQFRAPVEGGWDQHGVGAVAGERRGFGETRVREDDGFMRDEIQHGLPATQRTERGGPGAGFAPYEESY